MIDRNEKLAWLRLARSRGIGPVHGLRLVERFGNAAEAVLALPRLISTGRWPNCVLCPPAEAEREWAAVEAAGADLLVHGDPRFPERLRQIDDAPVVLVVRGELAHLQRDSVAIVGSRTASANGAVLAGRISQELAAAGLSIVSGLARGIDTCAHKGALEAGGTTVAFVAGGADIVYPPENAALTEAIAEHGCVISERPLGAIPRARDFPRRNRLIAGLSQAVVVVEAALQSGSLITAQLAGEQGREVMAVPGSPLDPRHRGTNLLLKQGATLVESAADILSLLRPLREEFTAAPAGRPDRQLGKKITVAPPSPTPVAVPAGAGEAMRRARELIGVEPVSVDELVRRCQASVAVVQEVLLELELDGWLERHPGNRVSRRAV
jgi:DNA processing protein